MKEKNFARKIENSGIKPMEQEVIGTEEKELSGQEIIEMGEDMKNYTEGLLGRINEIKRKLEDTELTEQGREELEFELKDSEEQIDGLQEFVRDIDNKNYEEITEK